MRAWGYWKHLSKITGWELWWCNHQFLSFLMRLKTGSRRWKGVDTRCLSRCRILRADALCWLRICSPLWCCFFTVSKSSLHLSDPVSQCWSTSSHFCPLCWECTVPLPGFFVVNLLALNSSFSSSLWFLLSSDSFSSSLEALQSPCQGACEDLYQRSILEGSQLTVSLILLQVLGHTLIKPASSQCKTSLLSPETIESRNLAKQSCDWSFLPQTPAILLAKVLINLLHWEQP